MGGEQRSGQNGKQRLCLRTNGHNRTELESLKRNGRRDHQYTHDATVGASTSAAAAATSQRGHEVDGGRRRSLAELQRPIVPLPELQGPVSVSFAELKPRTDLARLAQLEAQNSAVAQGLFACVLTPRRKDAQDGSAFS